MEFRMILCWLGILLAIPLLGLGVVAFTLPVSFSGALYIICISLIVAGLVGAPFLPNQFHLLTLTGLIGAAAIAGTRVYRVAQDADRSLHMLALPAARASSWESALIDERDTIVFGETLFHLIGGDSSSEHENLISAFSRVYSEMHTQGVYPSPVISTYLNLQQPDHFDAVIVEPDAAPEFGVMFLHGSMGNVTAQCWQIAQAVTALGGVTICPSTEWTGSWWQPDGQSIIQSTFDYLRAQGIQRYYLGGFSNGGFSIGRLASQWKDISGLNGLIFIDGFMNGTDIREVGLPVLIVQAAQDERVPVTSARQFAAEVGDLGTYVEMEGDHFLIMKQPEQVQRAIAEWLEDQESRN